MCYKFCMDERALGLKVEKEHSATIKAIIADCKAGKLKPLEYYIGMFADDHTEEIEDYYTRLIKMEKEAKEDHEESETPAEEKAEDAKEPKKGKKTEEEETDERVDKMWKSLKEEPIIPVAANEDPEPYYPSVSIECDSSCEYKVGEEVEIRFKAMVDSVRLGKKNTRVEFKLKEMAE